MPALLRRYGPGESTFNKGKGANAATTGSPPKPALGGVERLPANSGNGVDRIGQRHQPVRRDLTVAYATSSRRRNGAILDLKLSGQRRLVGMCSPFDGQPTSLSTAAGRQHSLVSMYGQQTPDKAHFDSRYATGTTSTRRSITIPLIAAGGCTCFSTTVSSPIGQTGLGVNYKIRNMSALSSSCTALKYKAARCSPSRATIDLMVCVNGHLRPRYGRIAPESQQKIRPRMVARPSDW